MPLPPWEFWIDVGGTFTDCLGRSPDGKQLRHKLLSSGVTKGNIAAGSRADVIRDPQRIGDPAEFWTGFRCTVCDAAGRAIAHSSVVRFDHVTGKLELSPPIEEPLPVGNSYELACGMEAPVLGIRYLLALPPTIAVPQLKLRLGTTRGTNALLTRTGARTALAVTRGFGDLLEIGSQDRPELFALTVTKSAPLAECTLEIDARVAADGTVLAPPEPNKIRGDLEGLRARGIESLAICLLHADLYPEHELLIEQLARDVGFQEISRSSEVAPLVKIVSRAETTVVDAYLNPVLRDYLARLHDELPGSPIRLMTSSGGLVRGDAFRGHMSVLSGPAGGVVGYAQVAASAGLQRTIGFDMGGTSTDVSRFAGRYEFEYETRKAGVRLVTPTLAINTVAAGGGSICRFDGTKLTVGPDSAGADPGPACYGRGGPLTVTDLNYFLGRIAEDRFPFRLERSAVKRHLSVLAEEVRNITSESLSRAELAEGLLAVANANMVRAIRSVSVAQGADPADYALVPFGGAAAQHACAVARELGMTQILYHPDASILSAYGIGHADVVRHAVQGVSQSLADADLVQIAAAFETLAKTPLLELAEEGFSPEAIEIRNSVDLRYRGTDLPLNIDFAGGNSLAERFGTEHRRQFGYTHRNSPIEIVALRIEAIGKAAHTVQPSERCTVAEVQPRDFVDCRLDGQDLQIALFDREKLFPGSALTGPALIADVHSTLVVESDWDVEMLSGGELLLTSRQRARAGHATGAPNAARLEIFNNLFAGIAEQMGHVLRRTALSVNVKERLDYSCAIFTAEGELVANAPHVPVHLGAMGATVRAVLAENTVAPGDVYVSNDPYRGGSHLPDVTVVTPVHHPQSGELLFFSACRAHHAEIGGVRPGSMPPNSRRLAEEGVMISNLALVKDGQSREDELRGLLSAPPYPTRRLEENLADIRAQVAANQQGARDLLALVDQYSLSEVRERMAGIQAAAEAKVRLALKKFGERTYTFTDYLETVAGTSVPITVKLTLQPSSAGPAAIVDFTGSAPVVEGNLNANRAIVSAAVLYVLRMLVDEDVPLNEGALRAVEIVLPPGLLNPPRGKTPAESPAVAAGNVETSQRVVDVLLGALQVAGASQGTMNNLLFGNSEFGYYETICGGSGGTAAGPGASAVQVHMTNTRATDPEVLERRLPVRLQEFNICRNSGGAGHHRGGDGVIRRLEFLAPLELSLITQRRGPHPPYGMCGGKPGRFGHNSLTRCDGKRQELPGICEITVQTGDVFSIETPGGGGYGPPH